MPRSGNTRERLVNTASRIFRSHGYSGSGVLEIQREAGISTGSFYHFFSSKEELLLAVLQSAQDTLSQDLAEAEASSTYAVDRIHTLFELHNGILLREDFQRGSPIAMLAAEFGHCSPSIRNSVLQIRELYISTIQSWLEGHRFHSRFTPHNLALLIHSILEGALLQSRLTGSSEPFRTVTSELEHLLRNVLEAAEVTRGGARDPESAQSELSEEEETGWKSW